MLSSKLRRTPEQKAADLMPPPENASPVPPFDISKTCHEKYYLLPFDHKFRQSITSILNHIFIQFLLLVKKTAIGHS